MVMDVRDMVNLRDRSPFCYQGVKVHIAHLALLGGANDPLLPDARRQWDVHAIDIISIE
jgi:hypothetical protein